MKKIDLNCDMGESFGAYTLGMDAAVIRHITSANVACGFHAGDPRVMDETVAAAKQNGVGVGAHPGYPDLIGFGRRNMDCTVDEIRRSVIYQIGALMAFCRTHNVPLQHVKAHGALYLTSVEKEEVARAVAEAVAAVDSNLIMVALAGKKGETVRKVGAELGLRVAGEAFPDRAYTPEGTLASRKLPGTVIHDPKVVSERALMMAKERKVIALDGTTIDLDVQTLCVHGDNETAVDLVAEIRNTLRAGGLSLSPMGEWL